MKQHSFKKIKTSESEELYRIIDLNDTDVVAITELYEEDDELDKRWAIRRNKEIHEKSVLGSKVIGYNIFIVLDEDNVQGTTNKDYKYLSSILRQMALYFKETEIQSKPKEFSRYALPPRLHKRGSNNSKVQVKPIIDPVIEENKQINPPIKKQSIINKGKEKNNRHLKKMSGWRMALIIIGSVFTLALITSIILWADTWKTIIIAILTLPMTIIMLLAFADDMFKRR